jgi:hypothetical protein
MKNKEIKMIARFWHGATEADKADEYVEYLNKTGIPDYHAAKGNGGAYILRKIVRRHGAFLYFDVLGLVRLLKQLEKSFSIFSSALKVQELLT